MDPQERGGERAVGGRNRPYLAAGLVSLLSLSVYLFLPSANFNGDGLGYAKIIEDGSTTALWSFSGRLLFCPAGALIQGLLGRLGFQVQSIYALQYLNSVFCAIAVGIYFLSFYKIIMNIRLALLAAAGLSFSLSFWFWSVNATSYPGNIFFLICCFGTLLSIIDCRSLHRYYLLSFLLGLMHAFSCGFWLTAVLLYPSFLLSLFVATGKISTKGRFYAGAFYSLSFALFLGIPLLIAAHFAAGVRDLSGFFAWLSSASQNIPPEISIANFLRGIIGFSSSIFSMIELGPYIKSIVFDLPVTATDKFRLLCEVISFATLWIIILLAVRQWYNLKDSILRLRMRLISILVLWLAPTVAFGLTWLGSDTERWLSVLPVFWIFLIMPIAVGQKAGDTIRGKSWFWTVSGFVGFVIIYNLLYFAVPNHDIKKNQFYSVAQKLDEQLGSDDMVMLWGYDILGAGDNLRYFFGKGYISLFTVANKYSAEEADDYLTKKIQRVMEGNGQIYTIGRIFLPVDVIESRYQESEMKISRLAIAEILSKWEREPAFVIAKDTYWRLGRQLEQKGAN